MRALAFLVVPVALVLGLDLARADDPKPAVDHSAFTKLLARYVDDSGRVDYATWKAKDLPALDAYLAQLAVVKNEATLAKEERLALWIDAYNAITLRAILDYFPVESIKDKVSHLPGGFNVWKDYKRKVAGREVFLDEIENEILRKMGEPRIHFAINCASKGCPVLRAEAYEGAKLDTQLEDQVGRFLANPKQLEVKAAERVVRVSKILDWFGADFGASAAERLAWLAKHTKDEAVRKVLADPDAKLEFLDYDWTLNGKP